MNRVFQRFVETLSCSPDAAALQVAMEETAIAFGLNRFAYLLSPRESPADVRLISNYPNEWTDHYIANAYDRVDPVIRRVHRSDEPFEWGSGLWPESLVDRENQLMDEAAIHGIRCGFTFPIHDSTNRIAAVTFAADQCPRKFRRCYETHRQVLQLLAAIFHSEACRVLAPGRCVSGILLTPREFECLEWVARGKSAWDIGQITGISPRTASFHIDNAKAKLGVRTISQAVALFASSRRVTP